MQIRIQKYLSESGICSRRKAEEYLEQGLIRVNGKIIKELGTKVDPEHDKVELESELVQKLKDRTYIILHKPAGYVTTCATFKEKNILELIKTKEHIFPVGRLDKDTTGLILLTNDGPVAYRLTHPKFYHEKEYQVVVDNITDSQIKKLQEGVKLDQKQTKPTIVKRISKNEFTIILTEGRFHHIKRICQKVGCNVIRLQRIRIENLTLKGLRIGEYRKLTPQEINELKSRLELL